MKLTRKNLLMLVFAASFCCSCAKSSSSVESESTVKESSSTISSKSETTVADTKVANTTTVAVETTTKNDVGDMFDKISASLENEIKEKLQGAWGFYDQKALYHTYEFDGNNFKVTISYGNNQISNQGNFLIFKRTIEIHYVNDGYAYIDYEYKNGEIVLTPLQGTKSHAIRPGIKAGDYSQEEEQGSLGGDSTSGNAATGGITVERLEKVEYEFYVPQGSLIFNNHAYYILEGTMTWTEAKKFAEEMGGYLVSITSQEEQDFIDNQLNTQGLRLWTGGYRDDDGKWKWVNGEEWGYTNWGDGEPNNSTNVVGNEKCVSVWPRKWNDMADNNIYEQSGFIVEFNPK